MAARTQVKICCIASPGEAAMAARAGADLLGLVGPMPTGPGPIGDAESARIAGGAARWATPVLLTAEETAARIAAHASRVGVRAVQIARHVAPGGLAALVRTALGLGRIQVVHVEDDGALSLIDAYAAHATAFLLDSGRPAARELGGTGRVHDWRVSDEFVRRSPRPVFLAGGLTPCNVGEAIRLVRPFGVDLCTGVRVNGALDPTLLAAFMEAVHDADGDADFRAFRQGATGTLGP